MRVPVGNRGTLFEPKGGERGARLCSREKGNSMNIFALLLEGGERKLTRFYQARWRTIGRDPQTEGRKLQLIEGENKKNFPLKKSRR